MMGADVTIYCLQSVTDYYQFERLCHDLMALEGYSSIEPLGGFRDKGRDAIHISKSGQTTVFAYSVREDWRAKLAEDASKIKRHGHTCDQLVFITTADFTAGERDEAVSFVNNEFGWRLDLFGIERLRVLLDVTHPRVKGLHPQIFPPALLTLQPQSSTSKDHVFISSAPEDSVLAGWLAKRLVAEGYLVWYERLNLLGGEIYPESVNEAIRDHTFCVIALYSRASLVNPEVARQRALALSIGGDRNCDFFIPIDVDGVNLSQVDRVTSSLVFISFSNNWASGLQQLLRKLDSSGCPKPLYHGKTIVARSLVGKDVLSNQTETLLSNCLQVESLPQVIHRFKAAREVPGDLERIRFEWAYRQVDPVTFLSFHQPPSHVLEKNNLQPMGYEFWQNIESIDGILARNLVSELIRKSLIVKCHQRGLRFCADTGLHYFPWGLLNRGRFEFVRPNGSRSHINVTGQRKFWRPSGAQQYRYYLAPVFSVAQDLFGDFTVLVHIRIRLTDSSGQVLPKRTAISRRKHLCKGWWNKEWLDRLLAVCQYLADDDKILIGDRQDEQIIIRATPVSLSAPLGINEVALDRLSFDRSTLTEQEDGSEDDFAYQGDVQQ
ncbi:MAG: TIR domain-containing protein [Anaerolineales bacterium]|nr:TIR domain-containing protein [Anaerolineales bacterium]